MNPKSQFISFVTLVAIVFMHGPWIEPSAAQLAPPTGASFGGSMPDSKQVVSGIAWFGVLEDGLEQAKRTGKPILLVSAAPQCSGVPGMW